MMMRNKKWYHANLHALSQEAMEKGIKTCSELAGLLGVDYSMVRKIFSAETEPSLRVKLKLIRFLRLTPLKARKIFRYTRFVRCGVCGEIIPYLKDTYLCPYCRAELRLFGGIRAKRLYKHCSGKSV